MVAQQIGTHRLLQDFLTGCGAYQGARVGADHNKWNTFPFESAVCSASLFPSANTKSITATSIELFRT
jgi:hypothetical protein